MWNQCICLTCYKQHEKAISQGTGLNRVRNQKQHYKSTAATDFYPPPPALSAGESCLYTCSAGERIKNNTPDAWTSIREYNGFDGDSESNKSHMQCIDLCLWCKGSKRFTHVADVQHSWISLGHGFYVHLHLASVILLLNSCLFLDGVFTLWNTWNHAEYKFH